MLIKPNLQSSEFCLCVNMSNTVCESPIFSSSEIIKKRKPKRVIKWRAQGEFASKESALTLMNGKWCKLLRNDCLWQLSVVFYCAEHGKQCSKRAKLVYPKDEESVVYFYESADQHDAERVENGLSVAVKAIIEDILKDGHKSLIPLTQALISRGVHPMPSRKRLQSYLKNRHTSTRRDRILCLNDLKLWCERNSIQISNEVPSHYDLDQPFVVNSYFFYERATIFGEEHKSTFRVFISTLRLLKLALYTNAIQADATHKVVYEGFPLLMVGVTDKKNQFHPVGLAMCKTEKEDDFAFIFESIKIGITKFFPGTVYAPEVLIAHSAGAIPNGFRSVFGDSFKRVNSWHHAKKNIDPKLMKLKDKNVRSQIDIDIGLLQMSPDPRIFSMAKQLFLAKWDRSGPEVDTFISYLKSEWLENNEGWFEGLAPGYPSTNNGLESTNRWLKEHHLLRNR